MNAAVVDTGRTPAKSSHLPYRADCLAKPKLFPGSAVSLARRRAASQLARPRAPRHGLTSLRTASSVATLADTTSALVEVHFNLDSSPYLLTYTAADSNRNHASG